MKAIFLALVLMTSQPLLVFTADWCPQCQRDKPAIARLQADHQVTIIDADAHPELLKSHGVDRLPTYILGSFRTHSLSEAIDRLR